jgi:hypothetical protein
MRLLWARLSFSNEKAANLAKRSEIWKMICWGSGHGLGGVLQRYRLNRAKIKSLVVQFDLEAVFVSHKLKRIQIGMGERDNVGRIVTFQNRRII